MTGNKLFVDTNILIYLLNGDPEITQMLDGKELVISVITELELLAVPHIDKEEELIIEQLIKECQIININAEVKKLTVALQKVGKLKLSDAIVAASSFSCKLPLLTADQAFAKVSELDVILYQAE